MEENQTKNNKKLIVISVLVILVIVILYYLYQKDKQTSLESLARELENSQKSVESIASPSANPFLLITPKATPVEKTNPFRYENPFE